MRAIPWLEQHHREFLPVYPIIGIPLPHMPPAPIVLFYDGNPKEPKHHTEGLNGIRWGVPGGNMVRSCDITDAFLSKHVRRPYATRLSVGMLETLDKMGYREDTVPCRPRRDDTATESSIIMDYMRATHVPHGVPIELASS